MHLTTIMHRLLRAGPFVFCLWPIGAQANVGVPLFTTFILYTFLLLIPIIVIEAYIIKLRLEVSIGRASEVAVLVNIASTILGTVAVLLVEFLLFFASIELYTGGMLDIAVLIALIPSFYLSVWIESLLGSFRLEGFSRKQIWDVFFLANLFSYAMLGILAIASLIKNAIIQGQFPW